MRSSRQTDELEQWVVDRTLKDKEGPGINPRCQKKKLLFSMFN